MVNKILTTLLLSVLVVPSVSADIKKGQKIYLKKCKRCHGNGTKGAAMKTQAEWEEAFSEDAMTFIEWHEGTKVEKYVNGKRFLKKYAPHVKDFLYHYASDSGNVPSCG